MNVLVIGNGGREHAILWKLAQSPRKPMLFAAPGNAGTRALATNLPVRADDVEALIDAVRRHSINLTIVGPESALVAGVVDRFQAEGLAIFGPTQAAARIETSKAFSKELMAKAGVPTAPFRVFNTYAEASSYVMLRGAPVVVKADGLAAGKGVVVAQDRDQAVHALHHIMVEREFGDAGSQVVVEECLSGQEVSVFGFTDGTLVSTLVAACDYKRVGDGDTGPNTGGMGGYSPPAFWTQDLERQVREEIMLPTIRALAREGSPYSGVLYGGLMLTENGPTVLEFNARFGDPEAQLVLPRLETDLLYVIEAVLGGGLAGLELRWSPDVCVGVVVASEGYPGPYSTGKPITGLDALPEDAVAFHAGTVVQDGTSVTSGGRVLSIVGRGEDLATARRQAYAGAAAVHFDGSFHRGDIATDVT
jgi:phosphoribosylamine--glycine ligase